MDTPEAQCIEWIYTVFGECVVTQQQAWSLMLGYLSIFCWLNAQLPQIAENFKLGSAESLSLQFLINWFLGDISNLVGCILTKQLPFQKYLAIYFCLADAILFGQFVYYGHQDRKRRKLSAIMISPLPETSEWDHHHHHHRIHNQPARLGTSGTSATIHGGGQYTSSSRRHYNTNGTTQPQQPYYPHHRQTVSVGGTPMTSPQTDIAIMFAPPAASSSTGTPLLTVYSDNGEQLSSHLQRPMDEEEEINDVSPLLQQHVGTMSRPRRGTTASTRSTTASIAHRRSTSIVLFGMLLLTLRTTMPTLAGGRSTMDGGFVANGLGHGRVFVKRDGSLNMGQAGHFDEKSPSDEPLPPMDEIVVLGRIFAWVCTVFYLSSRLPQIWKNLQRKSVHGLSVALFIWAFLGNLCYSMSVLNSAGATDPETSSQFLKEAVPYILGSLGTLIFDLTIFCQYIYYTRRHRRRMLNRSSRHHHHHHHHSSHNHNRNSGYRPVSTLGGGDAGRSINVSRGASHQPSPNLGPTSAGILTTTPSLAIMGSGHHGSLENGSDGSILTDASAAGILPAYTSKTPSLARQSHMFPSNRQSSAGYDVLMEQSDDDELDDDEDDEDGVEQEELQDRSRPGSLHQPESGGGTNNNSNSSIHQTAAKDGLWALV